jgi:dTDP-4-dehydrorhamnose 3,5-epimerase
LAIAGAWLIEPLRRRDDRGYFLRTFCAQEFAQAGLETNFVQRSASFNVRRGTLRGLHFQSGDHAEIKMVRCTRGQIFDVIVDLRPDQTTFRKSVHVELGADRANALYIPQGCAHGFLTLEDACEVYYEITPAYRPEDSAGIVWNDPDFEIPWPFKPQVISEKDRTLPTSAAYFSRPRKAGVA